METKYKFVETTGCTSFDFSVNEKSIDNISSEELNEALDYLFLKVKEGISDKTILFKHVVELFQCDEYENDPDICETCGDYRSSMIWNI